MVGNLAESVLSEVEAVTIRQIQLIVYEVKEKETPIVMGGLHVVVLNGETKELGKQTISLQRGIAYVVEMPTRETIKVKRDESC